MWLIALSTALAADTWFMAGPERVDVIDGEIGGMAVQLTGAVLARLDNPKVLAGLEGVQRVHSIGRDGAVVRIELDDGFEPGAWSVMLREQHGVLWAHPDLKVPLRVRTLPNDPGAIEQWHLRNTGEGNRRAGVDLHVEEAWELTRGAGVTVAVLDSGVDMTHPDLPVTSGGDFVDDDDDPSPSPTDEGGPHGTAASGLIAATGDNGIGVAGVAYEADLLAVRILGDEPSTDLSKTYQAFVSAVDAGAAVLNNSWGFSANDCPEIPRFDALWDAIDYAESEGRGGLGSIVVVSSGNGGCDISDDGFQQHPNMVSVGAINSRDRREGYSGYGSLLDIVAPSGGLLTTDLVGSAGYGSWQGDPDYWNGFAGTSASAPLVSGVVALMVSVNDRLTAAQARTILCQTAVRMDPDGGDWNAEGWSPWYGCGRVDAAAAVHAARNNAPTPPVRLDTPLPTSSAMLRWSPSTDPDGDILHYEVRLWRDGRRAQAEIVSTDVPWLDATPFLPKNGTLNWRVFAVDRFGPGPQSTDGLLQVVDSTESTGGCRSAPRGFGLWLLLPLLGRRARRDVRCSATA